MKKISKKETEGKKILNESEWDVVSQNEVTANVVAPVQVFRNWLTNLFGQKRSNSPATLLPREFDPSSSNDWVFVDLHKSSKVFDEMFNPEVSGDWCGSSAFDFHRSRWNSNGDDDFDFLEEITDYDDFSPVATILEEWAFMSPKSFVDSLRFGERDRMWKSAILKLNNDDIGNDFVDLTYDSSVELAAKREIIPAVAAELSVRIAEQIGVDIERMPSQEMHDSVRQILQEFAVENPEIGYCQGMNYVLLVLLHFGGSMTDELAHKGLSAIVKSINAKYYDDSLLGLQQDILRLQKFIFATAGVFGKGEVLLREVHRKSWKNSFTFPFVEHFSLTTLTLSMTDMMMTLFARSFPISRTFQIFDIAFSVGRSGMFAIYLAVLEQCSDPLNEAAKTFSEFDLCIEAPIAVKKKVQEIGANANLFSEVLARAKWYLSMYRSEIQILVQTEVDPSAPEVDFKNAITDIAVSDSILSKDEKVNRGESKIEQFQKPLAPPSYVEAEFSESPLKDNNVSYDELINQRGDELSNLDSPDGPPRPVTPSVERDTTPSTSLDEPTNNESKEPPPPKLDVSPRTPKGTSHANKVLVAKLKKPSPLRAIKLEHTKDEFDPLSKVDSAASDKRSSGDDKLIRLRNGKTGDSQPANLPIDPWVPYVAPSAVFMDEPSFSDMTLEAAVSELFDDAVKSLNFLFGGSSVESQPVSDSKKKDN